MNDEDQSNDLLRSLQATLAMHAASAPPPPTATIADVMAPKQPREPAPKKKAPPRSVVTAEVVESEAIVPRRDEPVVEAPTVDVPATALTVTQPLDHRDILSILVECIARGLSPAQAEEYLVVATKFAKI